MIEERFQDRQPILVRFTWGGGWMNECAFTVEVRLTVELGINLHLNLVIKGGLVFRRLLNLDGILK